MLSFAKPIIRARHIRLPRWSQISWTLMEWNPFWFTRSGSFSWGAIILTWVPSMHPVAQGKPPTRNKPCLILFPSARVNGKLTKSPNFAVKACVANELLGWQLTYQIPEKYLRSHEETNPKQIIWRQRGLALPLRRQGSYLFVVLFRPQQG